MTAIYADDYASNASRTQAQIKAYVDNILSLIKEVPGGTGFGALEILSGAIAPTDNNCMFTLESETGSTDTLTNITAGAVVRDGAMLGLAPLTGHTITIQHAAGSAGQIYLRDAANRAISDVNQITWVRYDSATGYFYEVNPDVMFLLQKMPGGRSPSTIVLASDVATPDRFLHYIQSQTGSTDDMKSIVATANIETVIVSPATGHTITAKHNTGSSPKIFMTDSADLVMTAGQYLWLAKVSGDWYEIGRFGFSSGGNTYVAQTADFTAAVNTTQNVDTSGAGGSGYITCTLPTAVGNSGKRIRVRKSTSGANTVKFNTTASQTINGMASGVLFLVAQYEWYEFESDGANWILWVK